MRAKVRRAWAWCAVGGALACGLFAAYFALRPSLPQWAPFWLEATLFMALSLSGVTVLAVLFTRNHYRKTLRALSDPVRTLRENPNPRTLVAFDPDLDL